MCRTRLELYSHTNMQSQGSNPPVQEQCINMRDLESGAKCDVNGEKYGRNESSELSMRWVCENKDNIMYR